MKVIFRLSGTSQKSKAPVLKNNSHNSRTMVADTDNQALK